MNREYLRNHTFEQSVQELATIREDITNENGHWFGVNFLGDKVELKQSRDLVNFLDEDEK